MRRATVPAIDPRQLGLPSPARVALAHAGRLQASAIAAIEGRASRPGTPDTVLVRIEGSMATYRCPHSIRFGSVGIGRDALIPLLGVTWGMWVLAQIPLYLEISAWELREVNVALWCFI